MAKVRYATPVSRRRAAVLDCHLNPRGERSRALGLHEVCPVRKDARKRSPRIAGIGFSRGDLSSGVSFHTKEESTRRSVPPIASRRFFRAGRKCKRRTSAIRLAKARRKVQALGSCPFGTYWPSIRLPRFRYRF